MMLYLELFWSFLQIGLFSFGGGYVALPLIQNQVVYEHGWLTQLQFSDIVTISEITPGPIAINAATFVGLQTAGFPGALVATFACVLPAMVIVILLAKIYYKYRSLDVMQHLLAGLRPAVVAMIASSGISLMLLALFTDGTMRFSGENLKLLSVVVFFAGFFVLRKWKPHPILVMGGAALTGILTYVIFGV